MIVPIVETASMAWSKVKVDQGFKILLRAIRESLHLFYDSIPLCNTKHKWNAERWLKEVTMCCQHIVFNGVNFSKQDIAGICILLYPTLGLANAKCLSSLEKHKRIFLELGPGRI